MQAHQEYRAILENEDYQDLCANIDDDLFSKLDGKSIPGLVGVGNRARLWPFFLDSIAEEVEPVSGIDTSLLPVSFLPQRVGSSSDVDGAPRISPGDGTTVATKPRRSNIITNARYFAIYGRNGRCSIVSHEPLGIAQVLPVTNERYIFCDNRETNSNTSEQPICLHDQPTIGSPDLTAVNNNPTEDWIWSRAGQSTCTAPHTNCVNRETNVAALTNNNGHILSDFQREGVSCSSNLDTYGLIAFVQENHGEDCDFCDVNFHVDCASCLELESSVNMETLTTLFGPKQQKRVVVVRSAEAQRRHEQAETRRREGKDYKRKKKAVQIAVVDEPSVYPKSILKPAQGKPNQNQQRKPPEGMIYGENAQFQQNAPPMQYNVDRDGNPIYGPLGPMGPMGAGNTTEVDPRFMAGNQHNLKHPHRERSGTEGSSHYKQPRNYLAQSDVHHPGSLNGGGVPPHHHEISPVPGISPAHSMVSIASSQAASLVGLTPEEQAMIMQRRQKQGGRGPHYPPGLNEGHSNVSFASDGTLHTEHSATHHVPNHPTPQQMRNPPVPPQGVQPAHPRQGTMPGEMMQHGAMDPRRPPQDHDMQQQPHRPMPGHQQRPPHPQQPQLGQHSLQRPPHPQQHGQHSLQRPPHPQQHGQHSLQRPPHPQQPQQHGQHSLQRPPHPQQLQQYGQHSLQRPPHSHPPQDMSIRPPHPVPGRDDKRPHGEHPGHPGGDHTLQQHRDPRHNRQQQQPPHNAQQMHHQQHKQQPHPHDTHMPESRNDSLARDGQRAKLQQHHVAPQQHVAHHQPHAGHHGREPPRNSSHISAAKHPPPNQKSPSNEQHKQQQPQQQQQQLQPPIPAKRHSLNKTKSKHRRANRPEKEEESSDSTPSSGGPVPHRHTERNQKPPATTVKETCFYWEPGEELQLERDLKVVRQESNVVAAAAAVSNEDKMKGRRAQRLANDGKIELQGADDIQPHHKPRTQTEEMLEKEKKKKERPDYSERRIPVPKNRPEMGPVDAEEERRKIQRLAEEGRINLQGAGNLQPSYRKTPRESPQYGRHDDEVAGVDTLQVAPTASQHQHHQEQPEQHRQQQDDFGNQPQGESESAAHHACITVSGRVGNQNDSRESSPMPQSDDSYIQSSDDENAHLPILKLDKEPRVRSGKSRHNKQSSDIIIHLDENRSSGAPVTKMEYVTSKETEFSAEADPNSEGSDSDAFDDYVPSMKAEDQEKKKLVVDVDEHISDEDEDQNVPIVEASRQPVVTSSLYTPALSLASLARSDMNVNNAEPSDEPSPTQFYPPSLASALIQTRSETNIAQPYQPSFIITYPPTLSSVPSHTMSESNLSKPSYPPSSTRSYPPSSSPPVQTISESTHEKPTSPTLYPASSTAPALTSSEWNRVHPAYQFPPATSYVASLAGAVHTISEPNLTQPSQQHSSVNSNLPSISPEPEKTMSESNLAEISSSQPSKPRILKTPLLLSAAAQTSMESDLAVQVNDADFPALMTTTAVQTLPICDFSSQVDLDQIMYETSSEARAPSISSQTSFTSESLTRSDIGIGSPRTETAQSEIQTENPTYSSVEVQYQAPAHDISVESTGSQTSEPFVENRDRDVEEFGGVTTKFIDMQMDRPRVHFDAEPVGPDNPFRDYLSSTYEKDDQSYPSYQYEQHKQPLALEKENKSYPSSQYVQHKQAPAFEKEEKSYSSSQYVQHKQPSSFEKEDQSYPSSEYVEHKPSAFEKDDKSYPSSQYVQHKQPPAFEKADQSYPSSEYVEHKPSAFEKDDKSYPSSQYVQRKQPPAFEKADQSYPSSEYVEHKPSAFEKDDKSYPSSQYVQHKQPSSFEKADQSYPSSEYVEHKPSAFEKDDKSYPPSQYVQHKQPSAFEKADQSYPSSEYMEHKPSAFEKDDKSSPPSQYVQHKQPSAFEKADQSYPSSEYGEHKPSAFEKDDKSYPPSQYVAHKQPPAFEKEDQSYPSSEYGEHKPSAFEKEKSHPSSQYVQHKQPSALEDQSYPSQYVEHKPSAFEKDDKSYLPSQYVVHKQPSVLEKEDQSYPSQYVEHKKPSAFEKDDKTCPPSYQQPSVFEKEDQSYPSSQYVEHQQPSTFEQDNQRYTSYEPHQQDDFKSEAATYSDEEEPVKIHEDNSHPIIPPHEMLMNAMPQPPDIEYYQDHDELPVYPTLETIPEESEIGYSREHSLVTGTLSYTSDGEDYQRGLTEEHESDSDEDDSDEDESESDEEEVETERSAASTEEKDETRKVIGSMASIHALQGQAVRIYIPENSPSFNTSGTMTPEFGNVDQSSPAVRVVEAPYIGTPIQEAQLKDLNYNSPQDQEPVFTSANAPAHNVSATVVSPTQTTEFGWPGEDGFTSHISTKKETVIDDKYDPNGEDNESPANRTFTIDELKQPETIHHDRQYMMTGNDTNPVEIVDLEEEPKMWGKYRGSPHNVADDVRKSDSDDTLVDEKPQKENDIPYHFEREYLLELPSHKSSGTNFSNNVGYESSNPYQQSQAVDDVHFGYKQDDFNTPQWNYEQNQEDDAYFTHTKADDMAENESENIQSAPTDTVPTVRRTAGGGFVIGLWGLQTDVSPAVYQHEELEPIQLPEYGIMAEPESGFESENKPESEAVSEVVSVVDEPVRIVECEPIADTNTTPAVSNEQEFQVESGYGQEIQSRSSYQQPPNDFPHREAPKYTFDNEPHFDWKKREYQHSSASETNESPQYSESTPSPTVQQNTGIGLVKRNISLFQTLENRPIIDTSMREKQQSRDNTEREYQFHPPMQSHASPQYSTAALPSDESAGSVKKSPNLYQSLEDRPIIDTSMRVQATPEHLPSSTSDFKRNIPVEEPEEDLKGKQFSSSENDSTSSSSEEENSSEIDSEDEEEDRIVSPLKREHSFVKKAQLVLSDDDMLDTMDEIPEDQRPREIMSSSSSTSSPKEINPNDFISSYRQFKTQRSKKGDQTPTKVAPEITPFDSSPTQASFGRIGDTNEFTYPPQSPLNDSLPLPSPPPELKFSNVTSPFDTKAPYSYDDYTHMPLPPPPPLDATPEMITPWTLSPR